MAKLCIFVPGILGSSLDAIGPFGRFNLWVNRALLAGGGLGYLALSPDGVTPPDPRFPTILAHGALAPYYDDVQSIFARQVADAGYDLLLAGQDWRLSCFRNGASLAQQVISLAAAYDDIRLVGHSQGGLVCRRAYQCLSQVGRAALVPRIVTLGTPHRGSWQPCAVFSGILDFVPQLVQIGSGIIIPGGNALLRATLDQVKQIAATWPGLYELLPCPTGDPLTDPFLQVLYDADSWPSAWGIQQRWLDWASGPIRTFLLDSSLQPPYSVLTCVAGKDRPTFSGWRSADEIGDPDLLRADGDGDGIVLTSSALLPGTRQYTVTFGHRWMPEGASLDGQLIEWLLEASPLPPVPVAALVTPGDVLLRGPPLAITSLILDP